MQCREQAEPLAPAGTEDKLLPYPYHSHSAQWEFYHVISGQGVVRHQDGTTTIEPGDCLTDPPLPLKIIKRYYPRKISDAHTTASTAFLYWPKVWAMA